MKNGIIDAWKSFLKLLRFLVWYVLAVAAVIYVLPIVGLFLEDRYDAMTNSVKLFSILGFFAAIALWQLLTLKGRLKASRQRQNASRLPDLAE
jgi:positive regulator of sigma E activity